MLRWHSGTQKRGGRTKQRDQIDNEARLNFSGIELSSLTSLAFIRSACEARKLFPPFSLAVFTLAPDLSFEYGPSLAFAENTTVLQSKKKNNRKRLGRVNYTQDGGEELHIFHSDISVENFGLPLFRTFSEQLSQLDLSFTFWQKVFRNFDGKW